jgi:hypothetical protein
MYILPLIVILLISLAIFLSPILAVIIFFLFLIGLGAYKFLGPGTEPEHASAPQEAGPPGHAPGERATSSPSAEEEKTGLWGETWPEERTGEKPS